MKLSNIQKRIQLPPKYLDCKMDSHLLNLLQQKFYGCCLKNYGYILEVKKILHLKNVENTVFVVKFEAECLRAQEGDRIEAAVCSIYPQGILILVKEIQKAFIPKSCLKGFTYESHLDRYISMDRKIEVGDIVQVQVTCVRFEKNKESWLCKLI